MKVLILLFISVLPINNMVVNKDCGEAYTQAENGYKETEKASMANNFEDQHLCLGKAITAFTKAIKLANECGCEEAIEEAIKALELVEKAKAGKTVDDGQKFSKKALEHAEEAMNLTNDCSY